MKHCCFLADTEDSGSHVSITPKLKQWIEKLISDANVDRPVPEDLRTKCDEYQEKPPRCVPLLFVQRIADYASQRQEQGHTPKARNVYLDDFLNGSKWYFAEGPAPKRRVSHSTMPTVD
jgi:hypothetical protein